MIRGLFRMAGLLLLAGAFIFLVYDGARSIADQTLRLTRLGDFWNDINQASQRAFQARVEGLSGFLWNHGVKAVLDQPVWLVLGIVGVVLLILFRTPKPLIGYGRD